MTKQEKLLFLNLCNYKNDDFDDKLINFTTPEVLGLLFYNRMHGVAFGVLNKHNLINKANSEFSTILNDAFLHNLEIIENYYACIKYIGNLLNDKIIYAILGSTYLTDSYPIGYRISRKIQILISFNDIFRICEILTAAGFEQSKHTNGYIKQFTPITELQHQTISYYKRIDLSVTPYLEVEIVYYINKCVNCNSIISNLLSQSHYYTFNNACIKSLNHYDCFIMLCKRVYNESTDIKLIDNNEDMLLYKFCDIYTMLHNISQTDIENIFARAKELNMEKECCYAIIHTAGLFNIGKSNALTIANNMLANKALLHFVPPTSESIGYIYKEQNTATRFFSKNRKSLLKEHNVNVEI